MDESTLPPPAPAPEAQQPDPLSPDPEVAALLDFPPVARHTRRHDGWPPERQRRFIAAVARYGNAERAAQSIGRSGSGAWKVRKAAGGQGFADAWDGALALYHARNPKPVGGASRGERHAGSAPGRGGFADLPDDDEALDEDDQARLKVEIFGRMLRKYTMKLHAERKCRIDGRIAEADFYVRQLTFIEVLLDLGDQGLAAGQLLDTFRALTPVDMATVEIVATPMSVLLEQERRAIWAEKGEPDRPPPADLGEHDGKVATGPAPYSKERDGNYEAWKHRQAEQRRLAAKAQKAWEKKARKEAEAWAERLETGGKDAGREP